MEYYLRDGVFYRRTASGYIVVPGPVGIRVDALPKVAVKVRVGAVELYYHYGTYYRDDPSARVNVVVKPEKEPARDVVVLVDGQTFTGEYQGGNERCIDLQVGEEVLEIGVRDIVSIAFSPRENVEEGK